MDIVDVAAKFVAKVLVNMLREGYVPVDSVQTLPQETNPNPEGFTTNETPANEVPYAHRGGTFGDLCSAAQQHSGPEYGQIATENGQKADVIQLPIGYNGYYILEVAMQGGPEYVAMSPNMNALKTFSDMQSAKDFIDADKASREESSATEPSRNGHDKPKRKSRKPRFDTNEGPATT